MPSPEHTFQTIAIAFLGRALPGVPAWSIDCGIFSDGSQRAQNAKMARRRRGILPGYPDLWLILAPMVAFELKKPKDGVLTDAQLARRDELQRAGHYWFGPVTTLEQIEACLVSLQPVYGYQLRASTGITVPVPRVSDRRETSYQRLNDQVPF